MTEQIKTYKEVLLKEKEVLNSVISNQTDLRIAVNNKDWKELMKVISDINLNMDLFNRLDAQREEFSKESNESDQETQSLLSDVRGTLVRCRTENKALGDYINITRNFVKGVIDTALPQSRAKVYSRTGNIVQMQPQSVVLNTLS